MGFGLRSGSFSKILKPEAEARSHHNAAVQRETLIDFFRDLVTIRGEFLVYDDGYRRRRHGYDEGGHAARGFAARLAAAGLSKGDKVVFWGENRPEWIVCYWGCLIAGVIVVPIDYRSSAEFVRKVRALVEARIVLLGDDVDDTRFDVDESDQTASRLWRFADVDWRADGPMPDVAISRDDIIQIIFTSGATAEPRVWSSATGMYSPTSFRWNGRSSSTGSTRVFSIRCAFSTCCRSATCSANRWPPTFRRW